MLDELSRQERADAQYPALHRRRKAWASLDPDVARRYAEAIAEPWATAMALLVPDPESQARAAWTRQQLDYLRRGTPEAVARRAAHRVRWAQHVAECRARWEQERVEVRDRIVAAGLTFREDLFLLEHLPGR
ncbi:hypothetical protein [Actinoplanes sp. NPDC020271]|uniref:hypothetical protein n=1 Tax=Actinoplanes sp. NPDC020271 TaxID=3363896 RepID=UPI00378869C6